MKVLYVEDDEEAREELTDVLRRRVGKVIVAENGRSGLEAYDEYLPDNHNRRLLHAGDGRYMRCWRG